MSTMEEDNKDNQIGTMISALSWVSRGFAKPVLEEVQPSTEEFEEHEKSMKKMVKAAKKLSKDKKQV